MAKKYTKEEKKILLKNKYVIDCSKGVITYTNDFKIRAVRQYHKEYLSPQEIFMESGFDIEILGKKKPRDCLERWNKVYKEKGLKGFSEEKGNKRGRPKKKDESDKDKIKRLQLEIEYLKAENDFLAKLRAKRRQS